MALLSADTMQYTSSPSCSTTCCSVMSARKGNVWVQPLSLSHASTSSPCI